MNEQLKVHFICSRTLPPRGKSRQRPMPPSKPRAGPDDSRSEASSTREKLSNGNQAPTAIKGRRTVGSAIANGSNLKDVVTANNAATAASNLANVQDGAGGVSSSNCEASVMTPNLS